MQRALGPVGVFMLRHGESTIPWMRRDILVPRKCKRRGTHAHATFHHHADVKMLEGIVGRREAAAARNQKAAP